MKSGTYESLSVTTRQLKQANYGLRSSQRVNVPPGLFYIRHSLIYSLAFLTSKAAGAMPGCSSVSTRQ
jgi:hypothetical protein